MIYSYKLKVLWGKFDSKFYKDGNLISQYGDEIPLDFYHHFHVYRMSALSYYIEDRRKPDIYL